MREAWGRSRETLKHLSHGSPRVTLLELDRSGTGYSRSDCIRASSATRDTRTRSDVVNDQVVHGIPTNRKLREGDLLAARRPG